MNEKILSVNFSSQWDQDAGQSNNDCGPCSLKMVLNFYGETVTTDEILGKSGAGKGYVTLSQLKTAAESYGYSVEAYANGTIDKVKEFIDKGIPVLMVVHYGDLSSRQDIGFSGPHIFLLVGYRDDGYFVNDPDFWGQFRSHGDHHFYKKDELEKAWANSSIDQNVPNTFMVILPKKVQIADNEMVIAQDLFKELRIKSGNLDKAADALGMTATNGYAFDDRKTDVFGDTIVNKIKDMQQQIVTLSTSSAKPITTTPTVDAEKTNALQSLLDKIKSLFGGEK